MNQQQSIGSNNQQQGLPDNRNQDSTPSKQPKGTKQQPEKPAVTDDAGNAVDKQFGEAGKGYSEKKPTETHSNIASHDDNTANEAPARQDKDTQKTYGTGSESHHENLRDHNNFPQQLNQEEKDAYEKRIQQSGNVPG